jgi:hypothetical protein
MDLLKAAAGLVFLREVLEPDSPQFKHATDELETFLKLSRVSVADALSIIEADDES